MSTLTKTNGNRVRIDQVEAALAELLTQTVRRGFFGLVRLELKIQDGTIHHIRRIVEQVEK